MSPKKLMGQIACQIKPQTRRLCLKQGGRRLAPNIVPTRVVACIHLHSHTETWTHRNIQWVGVERGGREEGREIHKGRRERGREERERGGDTQEHTQRFSFLKKVF